MQGLCKYNKKRGALDDSTFNNYAMMQDLFSLDAEEECTLVTCNIDNSLC